MEVLSHKLQLFSEHTSGFTCILITDTLQNQRMWRRQCQVIDRKLKPETSKQASKQTNKQKPKTNKKILNF